MSISSVTPWTVVCQAPLSMGFFREEYWSGLPSSRGSSQPSDRTQVSCIAGGFFLPTEPPGRPKNTGMGSLSLLQRIFPTQESN